MFESEIKEAATPETMNASAVRMVGTVGSRLNRARIRLGLTMDQLAKRMGFAGQSSIQRYLADDYNLPLRSDMEQKFSEALAFLPTDRRIATKQAMQDAMSDDELSAAQVLHIAITQWTITIPTPEQIIAALKAGGFKVVSADCVAAPVFHPVDPGTIIREITKRRDITPTELARKVGLTPSTLNRFLRDDDCLAITTRTYNKIVEWDNANP